jgi:hypothetical protein
MPPSASQGDRRLTAKRAERFVDEEERPVHRHRVESADARMEWVVESDQLKQKRHHHRAFGTGALC